MHTVGVIEADPRLQGDLDKAARRVAGKPLLEWVVRRVTDCQQLDGVIVVTGDAAQRDLLTALVPADVPVIVGSQGDPVARFAAALDACQADAAVRVCVDSPFVDPALIDRLVATARLHPRCDYVSYCSRDGRPLVLSPLGLFSEWLRTEAVRRADRAAKAPAERSDVARYMCAHPEEFAIRLIPAPPQLDRDDVRLTIDHAEDVEHAQSIIDALGTDGLEWQRIARLLDHQPRLRERMAALNRAAEG